MSRFPNSFAAFDIDILTKINGERSDDDEVNEDVSFETSTTFYSRAEASLIGSIASFNVKKSTLKMKLRNLSSMMKAKFLPMNRYRDSV
ncbi:hypothetical protein B5S27_g2835 [[Candida] boidinii]|nr:hypothetical protein B5S27_g2835 [[Candida] boidinii]